MQSTLGKGGMAVVYRAEDVVLGRPVALKTLHRRYAENPVFRQRFEQEARAMASLDHENIVRVYDIFREGQRPFIVAECVDGRDLGSLLGKGMRPGEHFTRKVASQLLEALAYAHRRGVIHCDIKPSNVLINRGGTVKVADFGIARLTEDDEAGEPGEIIGSARYMSPEQLTGQEATPGSDVYSVGILLYHCLTREPPFTGEIRTLARQQLHTEPRPVRELNGKVSPHMEAVVMKALAKDPRERYSSAATMLEDLRSETAPAGSSFRSGRRLLAASILAALLMLGGGVSLAAGLRYADSSPGWTGHELPEGARAFGEQNLEAPEPPPEVPAPSGQPRKEKPAPAKEEASAADRERGVERVAIPDVRTYFDSWAERTLARRGFEVRTVYDPRYGYANRGVAWATDPAIGTRVPIGSEITLYATPGSRSRPSL